MSHSVRASERTLVRVFGWTRYSDHYELFLLVLGRGVGERYKVDDTGPSSRSGLWDLHQLLEPSVLVSLSTLGGNNLGIVWRAGLSMIFFKVYIQTVSLLCFFHLTVGIWRQFNLSDPSASAFAARF